MGARVLVVEEEGEGVGPNSSSLSARGEQGWRHDGRLSEDNATATADANCFANASFPWVLKRRRPHSIPLRVRGANSGALQDGKPHRQQFETCKLSSCQIAARVTELLSCIKRFWIQHLI